MGYGAGSWGGRVVTTSVFMRVSIPCACCTPAISFEKYGDVKPVTGRPRRPGPPIMQIRVQYVVEK